MHDAVASLVGKKFPVLNDGFVQLVDVMGDDAAIVQAARVSYGKGTKSIHEDRGLIRFLMRNRHTSPFEMCVLKILVRVPMDCWRQWIRHRTASVNEYSTRYSEAIDSQQTTRSKEWRSQSKGNKQGSGEFLDETLIGNRLSESELAFHASARELYQGRVSAGVAREQARKDLPLSTYTEAYWKIDLHNLFHFLSLRMDSHAQKEIRDYANIIGNEIVARWVPMAWEAFCDYRLNGMFLTLADQKMMAHLFQGRKGTSDYELVNPDWFNRKENGEYKRNRERDECAAKLQRLGAQVPWAKK